MALCNFIRSVLSGNDVISKVIVKELDKAHGKAANLLLSRGDTLPKVLERVEMADSEDSIAAAIDKMNDVLLIFLSTAVNGRTSFQLTVEALNKLGMTDTFAECVLSATTLRAALNEYKARVLNEPSQMLMRKEAEQRETNEYDKILLHRYFRTQRKQSKRPINFLNDDNIAGSADGGERRLYYVQPHEAKRRKLQEYSSADMNAMKKNNICYNYQVGSCKRGLRCKFKHEYYETVL